MKRHYRNNDEYEYRRLDMNNPAHRAKARIGFKIHLFVYLAVIAMLWVIAILTGTVWQHPWPMYPMMGWGIGLMGHYFAAYRKFNTWVEREIEKEDMPPPREIGMQAQYLEDNADDFELKPLSKEKEKRAMPRDSDFI